MAYSAATHRARSSRSLGGCRSGRAGKTRHTHRNGSRDRGCQADAAAPRVDPPTARDPRRGRSWLVQLLEVEVSAAEEVLDRVWVGLKRKSLHLPAPVCVQAGAISGREKMVDRVAPISAYQPLCTGGCRFHLIEP